MSEGEKKAEETVETTTAAPAEAEAAPAAEAKADVAPTGFGAVAAFSESSLKGKEEAAKPTGPGHEEDDEEEAQDEDRVIAGEEDEEEVFKIRAKLFRFVETDEGKVWKERGLGNVRILKHEITGKCRVVMRQEKTLRLCANHLLLPTMKLEANVTSDRSWVYNTMADFADGEAQPETFAIRFQNAENARLFKEKFEECQKEDE